MKTIINSIIAITFTLTLSTAKAQAGYNDEPVTAETLLEMQDGVNSRFVISPIQIGGIDNGFTVQWKTLNERDIVSFELEAGENKKSFSIVKKMDAGNTSRPANVYQVGIKSSIIQGDKIYFRVKVNFANGTSLYTNESVVKMRQKA